MPPRLNVLKHVAEPLGHDLLWHIMSSIYSKNREDTTCNVRVCLSVKSNCGTCKLLFHHMLWLFSYLFTRRFILKGKVMYSSSCVCGPEALIPTKNWKIIKSSFCFLCVCCKAPASPYAFQIYLKQLYTVKRRRQQDNDKVSDIWKCKEWNSAFNRKTLLHFNALGLEHWYDMFGFELFKYS